MAARLLGLLSDYTAIGLRTAQRPCPQRGSVGHCGWKTLEAGHPASSPNAPGSTADQSSRCFCSQPKSKSLSRCLGTSQAIVRSTEPCRFRRIFTPGRFHSASSKIPGCRSHPGGIGVQNIPHSPAHFATLAGYIPRGVVNNHGLPMKHSERHRTHRTGWLRAGVLGANDGIVSTASLVLGVAATGASTRTILVTGVASLVAGAMSMAAGEYVSVSSQADTESADLTREKAELVENPTQEHAELVAIYVKRGLDETLASSVATKLMAHDALAAHARDELGISDTLAAKPVQAALASAGTFAAGAFLPLLMVLVLPASSLMLGLAASSLFFLALLGLIAARAGGSPLLVSATRVTFWGALAMGLTAGVGALFGVAA